MRISVSDWFIQLSFSCVLFVFFCSIHTIFKSWINCEVDNFHSCQDDRRTGPINNFDSGCYDFLVILCFIFTSFFEF